MANKCDLAADRVVSSEGMLLFFFVLPKDFTFFFVVVFFCNSTETNFYSCDLLLFVEGYQLARSLNLSYYETR